MLNDVNFEGKGTRTLDGSKGSGPVDLCPASLEKDINEMNAFIYDKVETCHTRSTIAIKVDCLTLFTERPVKAPCTCAVKASPVSLSCPGLSS